MPKLGDITSVWNTIRELNVNDIRDAAEAPVTIVVIGEPDARAPIVRTLRGQPDRYPARPAANRRDAIVEYDLPLTRIGQPDLHQAALIIFAIDGTSAPTQEIERVADKLSLVPVPMLVICFKADRLPLLPNGQEPDLGPVPLIFAPDTTPEGLGSRLVPAIVEHIPTEQHVAAARQLPGLRHTVANTLIADTSFSNATYALTSALPELVPVLNIPLNAADMLVLTKNQALLVYRLGLAFGAPPDFQAQLREIMPVIGSGFLWRQMARQLVGLIPGFGLVPKVAVAYGGTFATGQAAALWYSKGEALSPQRLNELRKQAIRIGRERARELMPRRQKQPQVVEPGAPTEGRFKRLTAALRRRLPGGKRTRTTREHVAEITAEDVPETAGASEGRFKRLGRSVRGLLPGGKSDAALQQD